MANDTFTTLNTGTGGDSMDESSITYGSAPTTRKRARVVIGDDGLAGSLASIFPAGFLRVSDEPTQIFYDTFDLALDTAIRWQKPLIGGSGAQAVTGSGNLTLGSGIAASGYSILESQPRFIPTVPGWIGYSFLNSLEFPVVTNGYRFWGMGTHQTTPTTSAPLIDAVGFEIDTAGKMYCVVYASGTRTVVQDLSAATGNSKQPADALLHRYLVVYRTDKTFFYIDGLDGSSLVASTTVGPTIQTLPVKLLTIAGVTPPVSSVIISSSGLAVWDTSKNNHSISDGTYGWRKAAVGSSGALLMGGQDNMGVIQSVPITNNTVSGSLAVSVKDEGTRLLLEQILLELQLQNQRFLILIAAIGAEPGTVG